MLRKIREAQQNEEGFTLIELLVVVIIIGILAAIAIPAFLNQRERAYQAELTSTLRNVALEVESEATTQNGDYDDTITAGMVEGFVIDLQGDTDGDGTSDGPVRIVLENNSDTEFCLSATHDNLTGADDAQGTADDENQVYESDEGGLGQFSTTGAAACVDAN